MTNVVSRVNKIYNLRFCLNVYGFSLEHLYAYGVMRLLLEQSIKKELFFFLYAVALQFSVTGAKKPKSKVLRMNTSGMNWKTDCSPVLLTGV